MAENVTAKKFIEKLRSAAKAVEASKTPEDDQSMGVHMRDVFALAKEFIDMPPEQIEKLLESPIHEVRAGAVSIMDWQARSKKTPAERRKELFDLYIKRHDKSTTGIWSIGALLMLSAAPL